MQPINGGNALYSGPWPLLDVFQPPAITCPWRLHLNLPR